MNKKIHVFTLYEKVLVLFMILYQLTVEFKNNVYFGGQEVKYINEVWVSCYQNWFKIDFILLKFVFQFL